MKYNYRVLLSEKEFLKVKLRASRLQGSFIEDIYYNKKDILFRTRSGTDPRLIWYQTVRLCDLEVIDQISKAKDLDKIIRESGLKVHCSCPAFHWWGMEYKAWKNGYGLSKETHVPRLRNPYQRGYVCSTGETEVLTQYGYRRIETISVGDLVYTHKGRLRRVLNVFKLSNQKVVELQYSGYKVRVTPDHQMLVVDTKDVDARLATIKMSYKEVSDLYRSHIVCQKPILEKSIEVPLFYAFLAGLYASDGDLSYYPCKGKSTKYRIKDNIYAGSININLSRSRCKIYKELFKQLKINVDKWYGTTNRKEDYRAFIRDKGLIEFVVKTCNFHSRKLNEEKRLSYEILSWSDEAKIAFLEGYFSGDGTFSGGKSPQFVWQTTNKQMFDVITLLLSNFWWVRFSTPSVRHITKTGDLAKQLYIVSVGGYDAKDLYTKLKRGLLIKGRSEVTFSSTRNKPHEVDGYRFREVIEVKDKGEFADVYTMEVEEDHSYLFIGGAVSRNCKHLYNAISCLPFISKQIAFKMKKYFEPIDAKNHPEDDQTGEQDDKQNQ